MAKMLHVTGYVTDVRTYVRTDGRTDGRTYGRMDRETCQLKYYFRWTIPLGKLNQNMDLPIKSSNRHILH